MEKDLREKIVDILEDIYGYEADDVVNKLLALLSPAPEGEKCKCEDKNTDYHLLNCYKQPPSEVKSTPYPSQQELDSALPPNVPIKRRIKWDACRCL